MHNLWPNSYPDLPRNKHIDSTLAELAHESIRHNTLLLDKNKYIKIIGKNLPWAFFISSFYKKKKQGKILQELLVGAS